MVLHSYRRVFRPERMIYSIEKGRALPIPIPWGVAMWCVATGVTVFLMRSGAPVVALGLAAAAAALGYRSARVPGALAGAVLGWAASEVGTFVLRLPSGAVGVTLVLFGLPVLVAAVTAGIKPDGRPLHNYVLAYATWIAGPRRMTLAGTAAPERDVRIAFRPSRMRYTPDWRSPILRAGRLRPRQEEAVMQFRDPVRVRRSRRGRWTARPATARLRKSTTVDELRLAPGETCEVRP